MAWLSTKDGRHFNTDWIDQNEDKKEKQIKQNKEQAEKLNKEKSPEPKVSEMGRKVANQFLKSVTWKKAVDGEESTEISKNHFSRGKFSISNEKMMKVLNAVDTKHEYRLEETSEDAWVWGVKTTVNHIYVVRDKI